MNRAAPPSLARLMTAELLGTFILIFFGCGAVHAAVLLGAQQGIWQVAIVWGVAIMLAAYAVGAVSGAHINPAVTLAFAAWRGFPKANVGPYIVAQLAGAFLAAAILFVIFDPYLTKKEQQKQVKRGEIGSVVTAMCYGEYFPSPGDLAGGEGPYSEKEHLEVRAHFTPLLAFIAEVVGTAILGFVVFAVTDSRNPGGPVNMAPVFIGLTVASLISVIGPLTQACFNPARDFGPRLFAFLAGWGKIALPGLDNSSWLTVYIIAPIVGGLLGSAIYEFVIRPAYPANGK